MEGPAAKQIDALIEREERERQQPYGTALDLGCGSGIWSVSLAKRGWDVTGIDVVPKAITRADRRAQEAGVRLGRSFIGIRCTDIQDATWKETYEMDICYHSSQFVRL